VPRPPPATGARVTTQSAEPTETVTVSPEESISPWPVLTLTLKVVNPSWP